MLYGYNIIVIIFLILYTIAYYWYHIRIIITQRLLLGSYQSEKKYQIFSLKKKVKTSGWMGVGNLMLSRKLGLCFPLLLGKTNGNCLFKYLEPDYLSEGISIDVEICRRNPEFALLFETDAEGGSSCIIPKV